MQWGETRAARDNVAMDAPDLRTRPFCAHNKSELAIGGGARRMGVNTATDCINNAASSWWRLFSFGRESPMMTPLSLGIIAIAAVATITATGVVRAQSSPSSAPEPASTASSAWDAPEPWRTDRFYFETSLYTRHFRDDAAHDNHQDAIVVEWNVTERWLIGAAAFHNSYGQPSQYVYGGYRFRPFESLQPLYFKVSAGLVHGYHGQYKNKIPFNNSGIAPSIAPSVGYCFNRFCSELVLFGAGAILTVGVTVPEGSLMRW